MNENLFEAKYDITKKSKLKRFYESNKILIFASIFILVILLGSFNFYLANKEKERMYKVILYMIYVDVML